MGWGDRIGIMVIWKTGTKCGVKLSNGKREMLLGQYIETQHSTWSLGHRQILLKITSFSRTIRTVRGGGGGRVTQPSSM